MQARASGGGWRGIGGAGRASLVHASVHASVCARVCVGGVTAGRHTCLLVRNSSFLILSTPPTSTCERVDGGGRTLDQREHRQRRARGREPPSSRRRLSFTSPPPLPPPPVLRPSALPPSLRFLLSLPLASRFRQNHPHQPNPPALPPSPHLNVLDERIDRAQLQVLELLRVYQTNVRKRATRDE